MTSQLGSESLWKNWTIFQKKQSLWILLWTGFEHATPVSTVNNTSHDDEHKPLQYQSLRRDKAHRSKVYESCCFYGRLVQHWGISEKRRATEYL